MLATQTLPQTRPGTMAVNVDGDAARRRHRQGHHPRHHRAHRHRRRHRPRHRVPRLGHPRPLDGGAHDGLQHVDRGRRPRRDGGTRRHDVRLPRGPALTRRAARRGSGRSTNGARSPPTTARRSIARSRSTRPRCGPTCRGAPTRHRSSPIDGVVPDPDDVPRARGPGGGRARPRVHGHRRPGRPSTTSRSTRCSSARAPTRASRTCAPRPPWSTGRRVQGGPPGPRRAGLGAGEGAGREPRASTGSSPPPASSGASRAARCAWP